MERKLRSFLSWSNYDLLLVTDSKKTRLDDGKIDRKPPYLMVKTMFLVGFPIHQSSDRRVEFSVCVSCVVWPTCAGREDAAGQSGSKMSGAHAFLVFNPPRIWESNIEKSCTNHSDRKVFPNNGLFLAFADFTSDYDGFSHPTRWFIFYIGLVVWNKMSFFHSVGNFIIPTDEVIFFRGVAQPPTRYLSSPEL